MELFRVHAYAVEPRRTVLDVDDADEFEAIGGPIAISEGLRLALDEAEALLQKKKIDIDLNVDSETRTSQTRDMLMGYGFGSTNTPVRAARDLAHRLANAMDARSDECLLVLAGYRQADKRRVSVWTFPREDAFQFKRARGRPAIELLSDIFSRRSRLRKGATFLGREIEPDFVRGGALDFQAGSTAKLAADFWVVEFLGARLAISSQAATNLLANAVARTHARLDSAEARTQLFAGVLALKANPTKRWTLQTFADTFLGEATSAVFFEEVEAVGNVSPTQAFNLDAVALEKKLNVRAFELEGGVLVSSPIDQIDGTVRVNGKKLNVSGVIRAERMRGKR